MYTARHSRNQKNFSHRGHKDHRDHRDIKKDLNIRLQCQVLRYDISLRELVIRMRGQLECLVVERLAKISLIGDYAFPPEPK